jgi:hypothetical protein
MFSIMHFVRTRPVLACEKADLVQARDQVMAEAWVDVLSTTATDIVVAAVTDIVTGEGMVEAATAAAAVAGADIDVGHSDWIKGWVHSDVLCGQAESGRLAAATTGPSSWPPKRTVFSFRRQLPMVGCLSDIRT